MIEGIMEKQPILINNERGSITVLAIMVLVILTLTGLSVVKTSSIEVQSVTNDHLFKLAFFSAESAKGYVMMNDNFYGVANIDSATPHFFPNNTDPYVPITGGLPAGFDIGNGQSFAGSVQYDGFGVPPRGSGYDTSKFRSHQYSMTCIGSGPRNTQVQIEAGFYRIGL